MKNVFTHTQLSLGVALNDEATFEHFYATNKTSAQIKTVLEKITSSELSLRQQFFLSGSPGVGLSHLLQAVCHSAYARGLRAQYLSLRELKTFTPADVLDGMQDNHVLCLDDFEYGCGDYAWEEAIFHLYNKLKDAGHCLVMGAHKSLRTLPIGLDDLQSRLKSTSIFSLCDLSDAEKKYILREKSKIRGIEMSEEVAAYILNRASRSMPQLVSLLNELDDVSLQQKRKLSIPFVKSVLSQSEGRVNHGK